MSRAERRAARKRVVERAKRKFKEWGLSPNHIETYAPKAADNMAKCSCWMCRGPARWTRPREKQRIEVDD